MDSSLDSNEEKELAEYEELIGQYDPYEAEYIAPSTWATLMS